MIGAGSVVSQNTALCHVQGSSGQMLHAGNANPTSVGKVFETQNGRIHTDSSINVAWNLRHVTVRDPPQLDRRVWLSVVGVLRAGGARRILHHSRVSQELL